MQKEIGEEWGGIRKQRWCNINGSSSIDWTHGMLGDVKGENFYCEK